MLEDLGTFAYATLDAHISHTIAPEETSPLAALIETAGKLRKRLAIDAAAAVAREYVDAEAVANVHTGTGRLETARRGRGSIRVLPWGADGNNFAVGV